jgi:nucleotide-binding universal stress UspA family protein
MGHTRHTAPRGQQLASVVVATDFSEGASRALARVELLPLAPSAHVTVVHVVPPELPARVAKHVRADARRRLDQLVAKFRVRGSGATVTTTAELAEGDAFVEIIRAARRAGAELIVIGRHGKGTVRELMVGTTAQRVIRKGDVPVLIVATVPQGPYERLLLPLDLQDTGMLTVRLALRLIGAKATAASVVHAHRVPSEGVVSGRFPAAELRAIRQQCKNTALAALGRCLDPFAGCGLRWKTTVRFGDPRTVIITETHRQRPDLIAIGTHGRSGISRVLLGSVADWVIQRAPCDVLVARPAKFGFEVV